MPNVRPVIHLVFGTLARMEPSRRNLLSIFTGDGEMAFSRQ